MTAGDDPRRLLLDAMSTSDADGETSADERIGGIFQSDALEAALQLRVSAGQVAPAVLEAWEQTEDRHDGDADTDWPSSFPAPSFDLDRLSAAIEAAEGSGKISSTVLEAWSEGDAESEPEALWLDPPT